MKDLAGRRAVIAASVAPLAHRRASRVLATAGSRIRQLQHQLAIANGRIAELELNEAEIGGAFIALLNTPCGLRTQLIAELAGLLGVELPP